MENSQKELITKIALTGNLNGLSDLEIWSYYQELCGHLGLNPISRPFDLMEKEVKDRDGRVIDTVKQLYPNVSCTTQLANKNAISYGEVQVSLLKEMNLAKVTVACSMRQRTLVGESFVDIRNKSGMWLENGLKKAATQARRRGTLQLCGIALPDESELPDIPDASSIPFDPPGVVFQPIAALEEAKASPDEIEQPSAPPEFHTIDNPACGKRIYKKILHLHQTLIDLGATEIEIRQGLEIDEPYHSISEEDAGTVIAKFAAMINAAHEREKTNGEASSKAAS